MKILSDNITIDDIKEGDIPEVMEIEKEAFSDPWSFDMFYSELFNPFSHIWGVREVSGRLIGYICFWRVADEAHILNLAVHKDLRRKGMASRLMQYAMDYWKRDGVKNVFLEVRQSNIAAQELYKKTGFNVILRRAKYYRNPLEDALIMAIGL